MNNKYSRSKEELEKTVSMYADMYYVLASAITNVIEKTVTVGEIKAELIQAHLKAEHIFVSFDDEDEKIFSLFK